MDKMPAIAKILLVDDNSAVRHALRMRMEMESAMKVCGEAENGQVAVEMVRELQPDVVLLDLSMPVMNGLEAARQISAIAPQTRMLMFTLHSSPALVEEAQNAGIKSVLSKSDGMGSNVVEAIRSVLVA